MEIVKYRAINKGAIVGSFSLKVPKWGLIINDCTLFEKNGRRWVGFPSKQYESNGEKKFFPLMQFCEKSHMSAFSDKVLPLVEQAMISSPIEDKAVGETHLNNVPF